MLSLKKLAIALAGPAVNLMFIFVFLLFSKDVTLVYINMLILLFNIIPIYPLDGGRILKHLLCLFVGKKNALAITNIISNITAIVLSIGAIILSLKFRNTAYIFATLYIWSILIKENKAYKIKRNMYKILENNIAINKD